MWLLANASAFASNGDLATSDDRDSRSRTGHHG